MIKVFMHYLWVLVLIVGGFLLVFSLYAFLMSIRPQRFYSGIAPEHYGVPCEKVSFLSSDGVKLAGWFVPKRGASTDKAVILMHGYPAEKGDIFPAFIHLSDHFNLLFFDFRYHGESGGSYTTIGGKEVNDLLGAIDYLKSRGIKRIGLFGFSMGGAVALMSLEKTQAVQAVVSESSYARLDWMALELYKPTFVLKWPLLQLTQFWSRLFLGMDLVEVSPVDKVRGTQVPILLMHSKADEMIPFSHALKLQEALRDNPNAQFIFRDNALHGMMDPEYQRIVEEFFRKHL